MGNVPTSLVSSSACRNSKDVPRRLMQIVDLPDELHLMIIENLEKPEIKMARLVCQKWCWISSPYLLNRVYFAPRRGAMDVFEKISLHPVFAEEVVELIFDSRIFLAQMIDRTVYAELFEQNVTYAKSAKQVDDEEGSMPGNLYDPHKLDFEQSLVHYKDLLSQQMNILSADEDTTTLREGLARMRNISRVIVDDNFPKFPHSELGWMDDPSYGRRSASEFGMSMLPSCIQDAFSFLRESHHPDFRVFESTGILHFFGALSHSNMDIDQLSMDDMPATVEFWSSEEIESLLTNVYPHLTALDLSTCGEDPANFEGDGRSQINEIVGHHVSNLLISQFSTKAFFSIERLRSENLVFIDIGECGVTEKLTKMSKWHHSTLKGLKLDDVWVDYDLPSTWSSIFSDLGQTLRLNEIALKELEAADGDDVSSEDLQGLLRSVMQWVSRESLLIKMEDGFSFASRKSLTDTSHT